MMYNRILLFVSFFISSVFFSSLFAQSSLSFGASGVQHEDTLSIGDSIHFTFWLVNQGSGSINDSISISCETFDIFGTSISSMSIGGNYNTVGSLDVGDSIFVTITEIVTFSSYALGDNIVVIWPAYIGLGGVDTSMTDIHILGSLQSEYELDITSDKFLLFPNPSSGKIYINGSDISISSIHISDFLGNIVFEQSLINLNDFVFDVGVFKHGIYFLTLNLKDRKITKKIVVN